MGADSYLHVSKSWIHRCDLYAYGLGATCFGLRDIMPTAMPLSVDLPDGNRGRIYFFHSIVVLRAVILNAESTNKQSRRLEGQFLARLPGAL
jgi:hypothetical protein